jgi:RNA polymerase sigma factor (sigma-70 family)
VRLAGSGDAAAYELLVRRYQEVAWRTACLITGDTADAEDVAQEAFVKAYLALPRFRPGAAFRPWLLTIVANEARNRRRSAGRRGALALRAAEPERVEDRSAETQVIAAESRAALLGALSRLRDDDRLVLGCRYLLELSEAETAAALGVPAGTVKSRTSRALERLRGVVTA